MDFTVKKCAYCNEKFTDSDDIVVCPECGAPHHRKCWFKKGSCACEELHGKEVDYTFTQVDEEQSEPLSEASFDAPEGEPSAAQTMQNEIKEVVDELQSKTVNELFIDGEAADIYEVAIGKNQRYYIPRFLLLDKAKRAKMWNTIAFFTPLSWSVYRKLYKFAAAFLALYIVIIGVTFAPFVAISDELEESFIECYEEDEQFAMNILNYSNGVSGSTITQKQQKLVDLIDGVTYPYWVSYLIFFALFAARVVFGFAATPQYLKSLKSKINRAKTVLSDKEDLKLYLARKCGTLPLWFAVIIALLELRFLLV